MCVRKYSGHQCSVLCCIFNTSGNLIATGSSDESLKVWETRSGKCLLTMPAHSDPVNSVSFSLDNTLLLSASFENMVRLWDVRSGACLKNYLISDRLTQFNIRTVFSPGVTLFCSHFKVESMLTIISQMCSIFQGNLMMK